jgi:hypothetical protein
VENDAALRALQARPPGLPRYAVLAPDGPVSYESSRSRAEEQAGLIGGSVLEREEPAPYQRNAAIFVLGACRACTEGCCTLTSHQGADMAQKTARGAPLVPKKSPGGTRGNRMTGPPKQSQRSDSAMRGGKK